MIICQAVAAHGHEDKLSGEQAGCHLKKTTSVTAATRANATFIDRNVVLSQLGTRGNHHIYRNGAGNGKIAHPLRATRCAERRSNQKLCMMKQHYSLDPGNLERAATPKNPRTTFSAHARQYRGRITPYHDSQRTNDHPCQRG